jgi:hypothetical protein
MDNIDSTPYGFTYIKIESTVRKVQVRKKIQLLSFETLLNKLYSSNSLV